VTANFYLNIEDMKYFREVKTFLTAEIHSSSIFVRKVNRKKFALDIFSKLDVPLSDMQVNTKDKKYKFIDIQ